MAFEYNDDKKETGTDVTLQIAGDSTEFDVTTMSYSEEVDTSEVQFNNSYTQNVAVTSVSYSGSFEIAGRNHSLYDKLYESSTVSDSSEQLDGVQLPSHISSITIIDGDGREYDFQNVLITSHSKDAPADDRVTESYDFTAERLIVS
jgi:hypothetical protein